MAVGRLAWGLWGAAAVMAAALGLAGVLRPLAGPPTLEQRAVAIAAELRCPVCAGESAAAADVPEARAMRAEIAADLAAGMSERQILDRFVAQYGPWILYRPPARGPLRLLWLAPAVAVAVAAAVLWRQAAGGPPPGSEGTRPAGEAGGPAPELERELRRWL